MSVWTHRMRSKIPLLGKGGVAAPSIKCREASFEGADGVVGSTSEQICDEVDRTTPCPSFAKEGNSHPGVTCVQSPGLRPQSFNSHLLCVLRRPQSRLCCRQSSPAPHRP